MARNWPYAELSKVAKLNGGPAEYVDKMIRYGFQKGVAVMIPICIGGCVLTYIKGHQLVKFCKDRLKLVTRKEVIEAEQAFADKMYQKACEIYQKCPKCGKTATGIDEIIALFGFQKTEFGLQPYALCKECREKEIKLYSKWRNESW
uniref:hypothetical protein n=1 Tax=Agathobacter sp. TaxID=2021311 RepID=UPI0040564B17